MREPVKRDYRSSLRAAQAAETRRAIVGAAHALFVADGYTATTIDAIAERAGISRKTVFTAIGGKVELLKTAVDWAVAGDDELQPLIERPRLVAMLAYDDPARLLAAWAELLTEINTRVAGLSRAMEVAAETDADARRLLEAVQQQRYAGAEAVVARLVKLKALAPRLPRSEAVDIAWLLTEPVHFDRLVGGRGWTLTRFVQWLSRSLISQLCGSETQRGKSAR